MNMKQEQQDEMFMNIAAPGAEEDVKDDMRRQHYEDTHDASAVWADDQPKKKKR
jgi:hypothetical protein